MKKLVRAIMVAIGLTGCTQDSAKERWSVANQILDGHPFIARYRADMPAGVRTSDYPHLISIVWDYTPSDDSGMPSKEDASRMDALETRLDAAMGKAGIGFMTVITTTQGRREWMWQTSDRARFQEEMNECLRAQPVYPIDITGEEDPEWRALQAFRSIK